MENHTAFNKWNPTELIGQLMTVLRSRGLNDLVEKIQRDRLPEKINRAWLATKNMTPEEVNLLRGKYSGLVNQAIRVAHRNRELRPLIMSSLKRIAERV